MVKRSRVAGVDRELARLLDDLRRCAPAERIELREPILAHGKEAIGALERLVGERSDLGYSVVAWLEVLAKRDPALRPVAVAAMVRLETTSDEAYARFIGDALARLGLGPSHPPAPGRHPRATPRSAGTEWPGFQAHEFGRNEGTHWRSADGRESLAPILTTVLRELDDDFISYGVERSPQIHFALARRYKVSHVAGFTSSKLFVYAPGPTDEAPNVPAHVAAGWYIERGDGSEPYGEPDDARVWDWPLFLDALTRPSFQTALAGAMARNDLVLGDYPFGYYGESVGWRARMEGDEIVARDEAEALVARGWAEVAERLRLLRHDLWVNLHVVRTWPAAAAIEAGQPFGLRDLAPVLVDLARPHLQMLRETTSGG